MFYHDHMNFILILHRIGWISLIAFKEPNHTMLEVKWVMHCMAILDLLASPSNKHLVVHVSLNG